MSARGFGLLLLLLVGCGQTESDEPVARPPVAEIPRPPTPKPQDDWTVYRSPEGGFEVAMPQPPEISTQEGRLFTVHVARCSHRNAQFILTYMDPPAATITTERVENTLRRDRDQAVERIQGVLRSERKVTIARDGEEYPGLDSTIENATGRFASRLYAVGDRVYSLQVAVRKEDDRAAEVARFLNSFVLKRDAH